MRDTTIYLDFYDYSFLTMRLTSDFSLYNVSIVCLTPLDACSVYADGIQYFRVDGSCIGGYFQL